MRLAEFIRNNMDPIIGEWEDFARTLVPAADHMGSLTLRDHIQQILEFIIVDIESAQTTEEQADKSRGEKPASSNPSAAGIHASLRYDGGFNMDQMVSEYRALRASVVKLWNVSKPDITEKYIDDLTRFNESIDQALTESIRDYSKKLELSRNLFLGILSHDLRNPLGAISMSSQLTMKIGTLTGRQSMLQAQITDSTNRALEIVNNLLDLTRARLGSGLPILRQAMDMGFVANQLVDEMRALHPNREFLLKVSGPVTGIWDKARIGQIFSNLIANAVQYGFRGAPITVRVEGLPNGLAICVHNEGTPIAADALRTIFNALARAQSNEDTKSQPVATNLGLGLYITKEIVVAHGGTIDVTSSEFEGTTFKVFLPTRPDD
ncbi:sensor histidine kinase [Asticcacaulis solisilvae]|uniref:sensor histidine kinase n=1 Tax=Asticcacaulis solisilvae TaxID=1217274 RepID=UPI003FD8532F